MTGPAPLGQTAGVWECVLADDFDGPMTAVDADHGYYRFSAGGPVWRVWYPDWLNNYAPSPGGPHANNPTTGDVYYDATGVSVANSAVTFTARPQSSYPGLNLTSGMIQSNPAFTATYGYAEARMRLPAASKSWPAFWLAGAGDYSINSDEFDILEAWGDGGTSYSTTTWKNGSGGQVGDLAARRVSTDITAWHTYGAAWSPDGIVFYLDGVETMRDMSIADTPSRPMYVLLNLSVQKGATLAQYPASMDVDWVRFYKQPHTQTVKLGTAAVTALYAGSQQVSPTLLNR